MPIGLEISNKHEDILFIRLSFEDNSMTGKTLVKKNMTHSKLEDFNNCNNTQWKTEKCQDRSGFIIWLNNYKHYLFWDGGVEFI